MLNNTFLHIPGVGPVTEQRFWDAGIHSWKDFIQNAPTHLSQLKLDAFSSCLLESYHHLACGNPNYFSRRLPTGQHWRLFPEFRNSTVYLDIETTGLANWQNEITTIALYDGGSISYYINGRNLDDFKTDIEKYAVIVSYNGKTFDVPFIENYFGIKLDHAHIDLRYDLRSLGYRGGLKRCETQLGLERVELKDIDGFFAVLLWHDYQQTGNPKSLETLLAYNIQDVLTLEKLMVMAYNLKIKNTPFYKNRLPEPVSPRIPFNVDRETVSRIRRENIHAWYY